ncbi:MAG: metallophosphoesterase family protein [Bacteroidetes bacterium]|nr:metallophosphoesterase family protein [Bacteroidota bacterium]MBU1372984.1 metallophosphoesterase family protein [Bacteroidota bacterium]MBU1485427.1 metallophosphoesterase family protein [Bacteroidota bacterium]MBU1760820.1 metallophosphoesterase family protein [Bacteroidota bacterium]MBU2269155.1 metallophosphoesterase family protein [Bacteroidota bacterium]
MEKIIKDLGTLNGKIMVFGGVYSNLQALEAIKELAFADGISSKNIICTGDIVAYCAQPKECITLIKDWGIHCIAGNVELNLVNDIDHCGCNFEDGSRCDTFSRQWYPYLKSQVNQDDIDWLATIPEFLSFAYADKKMAVVHGSYFDTSEFIFKSTEWEKKQANFDALNADIILAGHCGLPFSQTKNDKLWLNAGVIGMPANDGTPKVWYAILDDSNGFNYEIKALRYDFEKAAELMDDKPLPKTYQQTLRTGIWDNCEILPETETKLQGIPLVF